MPVVRHRAYHMQGSWDLGGSSIAASTACGRTTAFALREPMCGISAQFLTTHQSVRLHGKTHRLFLSGRSSNGTASMGTRFSVRVIAHERHFRFRASAYSSNFWKRHHARATSELAGWRSSFSFFCFCFAWFCTKLKQYRTAFT